ncbi:MAG: hypothetical protein NC420_04920 [Eubacterium sp.]|nr:hypothetical protein [Eubacterium sp.]MCM1213468.1 hypothetical protein [Lachnospiraceae bacterium]MCM1303154.1 hypothetical protein [Butyrivibrio sp.]MCM1344244.1 hypothetical protein [Muribaculaceae bacterium]MCM1240552.1 hypothetical protein [Lachnospiraceae bacterium]
MRARDIGKWGRGCVRDRTAARNRKCGKNEIWAAERAALDIRMGEYAAGNGQYG